MLAIRLRRIGKRKHATFRFIVSEKTRSPQSTATEFLGSYNPHTNPPTVNLKRERVEHWLKHGAQPSETVHNILVDAGLLPGPKVRVARPKKKPTEETTPKKQEQVQPSSSEQTAVDVSSTDTVKSTPDTTKSEQSITAPAAQ